MHIVVRCAFTTCRTMHLYMFLRLQSPSIQCFSHPNVDTLANGGRRRRWGRYGVRFCPRKTIKWYPTFRAAVDVAVLPCSCCCSGPSLLLLPSAPSLTRRMAGKNAFRQQRQANPPSSVNSRLFGCSRNGPGHVRYNSSDNRYGSVDGGRIAYRRCCLARPRYHRRRHRRANNSGRHHAPHKKSGRLPVYSSRQTRIREPSIILVGPER